MQSNMRLIIILLFLTCITACGQQTKKLEQEKANQIDIVEPKQYALDTVKNINLEYLDWDSLKINNQLPLLCKKISLIKLLGQPDSIVTPDMNDICVSYFGNDFKYVYFNESRFETYGDEVVISSINFENNNKIKLNFGTLTLDNSLTLEQLETIFPIAVRDKSEIDIYRKVKADFVRLATSKVKTDNAWLLFFKNGKLIRIDYWMPC